MKEFKKAHIEVDGNISTKKSHEIQKKLEALTEVDKVFVHVDPV